jgi:hypothetical protein
MTLADLALPLPYSECKDLALVYPHEVAVALYELQKEHGDWRHICYGRQRTDGTWMIDGEVLSMVGDGDPYSWILQYLSQDIMDQIEVVLLSEAVAMLPVPVPEDYGL